MADENILAEDFMLQQHLKTLAVEFPYLVETVARVFHEVFSDHANDITREDLKDYSDGINSRLDALYELLQEQNRLLRQLVLSAPDR